MPSESGEKTQWLAFWQLIYEEARRLDLLDADRLQQNDEPSNAEAGEPN